MDGKQAISLRWQRSERPSSHAVRPRRGRTHPALGPLPARLGPLDGTRFLFIKFVLFKTASMRGCRDAGVRSRALRAAVQGAARTSWKQRPASAAPPSRQHAADSRTPLRCIWRCRSPRTASCPSPAGQRRLIATRGTDLRPSLRSSPPPGLRPRCRIQAVASPGLPLAQATPFDEVLECFPDTHARSPESP